MRSCPHDLCCRIALFEPMLGSDWFRCNKIMWDFSRDVLSWNGKSVKLMTGKKIKNCARIKRIRVQQQGNWRPLRAIAHWERKGPVKRPARSAHMRA